MTSGPAGEVALLVLFGLTASVWVGGLVTLVVVARVATATLGARQRIDFFRMLGRVYGPVAGVCLLVAFATGAALVAARPWDTLLTVTAALAAALVVTTGFGVAQARRMTRRRAAVLAGPADGDDAEGIRRGALRAAVLRSGIAVLTLALVVCGALLAASA